ncbi:MAG: methyltransferase domain-containing protein [Candidatus Gracilibacteria bacterium]|nr:methyltransferase domain-containing protein [Candidatus Gracilibacteria bacterium]
MNNLPTWIHPALIQAHLDKQALPIKNQINETKTGIEKVTGNEEKQEKIRNSPQRAPSISIKSLIDFLRLDIEEFKGKNIVDLGGGFGGVAKILNSAANNITIVDPIFSEDIERYLENNIENQKYFIYARKEFLKNNRNKSHINAEIFEGETVLEEIKWWLDYSPTKYPNVTRNPSYAENIVGVGNESQDFVFCNYVLSKETIDLNDAIKELNRILKSGGKIIYSDYGRDEKLIEEFKKYFSVEISHEGKDGIIIICTK